MYFITNRLLQKKTFDIKNVGCHFNIKRRSKNSFNI